MIKAIEFYTIQSTGWPECTSWFDSFGGNHFTDKAKVISAAEGQKKRCNNLAILFRIVKHTITNTENSETHIKEYTLI